MITLEITPEGHHRFVEKSLVKTYFKSVSKVKEAAKKPFDREGISKRISKRDGIPVEDILAAWDKATKEGHDRGNKADKAAEKACNGELPTNDYELKVINAWNQSLDKFIQGGYILIPQCVIGCYISVVTSKPYGLAGIPDCVAIHFEKKEVVFIDCKADKEINYQSYNGCKMMLDEMSEYQDCNANEYSMQLVLYALIFIKRAIISFERGNKWTEINLTGFTITGLYINHFNGEKFNLIDVTKINDVNKMKTNAGKFVASFFEKESVKSCALF